MTSPTLPDAGTASTSSQSTYGGYGGYGQGFYGEGDYADLHDVGTPLASVQSDQRTRFPR